MRQLKLLSLLVVVLLLTGCLSPRLNFTISPATIIITEGQDTLENLVLKVKTSGFSLKYVIDQALVEITGEDREEPLLEKVIDPGITTPVGFGAGKDVKLDPISLGSISELQEGAYETALKGKQYTLTIVLTGTKESKATAVVKFE